jgi:hypothetical protein
LGRPALTFREGLAPALIVTVPLMRAVFTVLILCVVLIAPARAATWTEVRTPHYVFLGNARSADIRAVAQRFEQFYEVMQQMLSRTSVRSGAPTVVLVFADERLFRPYQPLFDGKRANVGGFFIGASDLNYVTLNVESGAQAYPAIFHELTHLIIANAVRQPPLWFNEGLAEYYSKDQRSRRARPPRARADAPGSARCG